MRAFCKWNDNVIYGFSYPILINLICSMFIYYWMHLNKAKDQNENNTFVI